MQRLLDASANLPQFVHDLIQTQAVTVAGTEAAAFLIERAPANENGGGFPRTTFEPAEEYEDLEVEIDGRTVGDPERPRKVLPDVKLTIFARAAGREEDWTELQGWALLQKLRMSPPTESVPVIVCTAATNWRWSPTTERRGLGGSTTRRRSRCSAA